MGPLMSGSGERKSLESFTRYNDGGQLCTCTASTVFFKEKIGQADVPKQSLAGGMGERGECLLRFPFPFSGHHLLLFSLTPFQKLLP